MADYTYRCTNCFDSTERRRFNVSHLSTTCSNCGAFAQFIDENVFEQFRTFEESPPDSLDWEQFDQTEKVLVCNEIVRGGRSLEELAVEES